MYISTSWHLLKLQKLRNSLSSKRNDHKNSCFLVQDLPAERCKYRGLRTTKAMSANEPNKQKLVSKSGFSSLDLVEATRTRNLQLDQDLASKGDDFGKIVHLLGWKSTGRSRSLRLVGICQFMCLVLWVIGTSASKKPCCLYLSYPSWCILMLAGNAAHAWYDFAVLVLQINPWREAWKAGKRGGK